MPSTANAPDDETLKDDLGSEWETAAESWWQISFRAVSWSYPDQRPQRGREDMRSCAWAKPPHYHNALFDPLPDKCPSIGDANEPRFRRQAFANLSDIDLGNVELNQDLVGVKGAWDTMLLYEHGVGIYGANEERSEHGSWRGSITPVAVEEVEMHNKCWRELAQDLIGGSDLVGQGCDELSLLDFPCGSTPPTPSFIDVSDSERSVNSMPSTPKANGSPANVILLRKEPGSTDHPRNEFETSPSRRLNASASSFIPNTIPSPQNPKHPSLSPSPSPLPSLGFVDFSYPSLNPTTTTFVYPSLKPLPTVALQKDEQGFWTEVETVPNPLPDSQRHSSSVPPSRPSTTVNYVTPGSEASATSRPELGNVRLETASNEGSSSGDVNSNFPSSSLSPLDREAEGKGRTKNRSKTDKAQSKARRTRKLCLALDRHRSSVDDSIASDSKECGSSVHSLVKSLFTTESTARSVNNEFISRSSDGWIEGPSATLSHSKSRPAPPYPPVAVTILPASNYPPVYFHSPPIPLSYGAAAPMQTQLGLAQHGLVPFAPLLTMYPVAWPPQPPPPKQTLLVQPPAMASGPTTIAMFPSRGGPQQPDGGITGASGIMHAQW